MCLPEENSLDLGIWMSIQSLDKHMHQDRYRDPSSLTLSVQYAWNNLPVDITSKIFIQQIFESGRDNINVEES